MKFHQYSQKTWITFVTVDFRWSKMSLKLK
jgi:hypothetical protein